MVAGGIAGRTIAAKETVAREIAVKETVAKEIAVTGIVATEIAVSGTVVTEKMTAVTGNVTVVKQSGKSEMRTADAAETMTETEEIVMLRE